MVTNIYTPGIGGGNSFQCRVRLNSVYEPVDGLYIDYTSPAIGGDHQEVMGATCTSIWVMMLVCKPDGVRFPNNGIEDKLILAAAAQV